MSERWKVVVCPNKSCMSQALDDNGKIKEEFKIFPDVDTAEFTQFTCRRCGQVETWGVTRKRVMKILYERINDVRVVK